VRLIKCDRCSSTVSGASYNLRGKAVSGDMNVTPFIFPRWTTDLCGPCWVAFVDFVESWGDAS
jgi:hypothetical protein